MARNPEVYAFLMSVIENWRPADDCDLLGHCLDALDAAGYAIVPREPTAAMIVGAVHARWQSAVRDVNCVREIYTSMIAAAEKGE